MGKYVAGICRFMLCPSPDPVLYVWRCSARNIGREVLGIMDEDELYNYICPFLPDIKGK